MISGLVGDPVAISPHSALPEEGISAAKTAPLSTRPEFISSLVSELIRINFVAALFTMICRALGGRSARGSHPYLLCLPTCLAGGCRLFPCTSRYKVWLLPLSQTPILLVRHQRPRPLFHIAFQDVRAYARC